jgi:hypothetical protein
LDLPPPAAHISYDPGLISTQYGWVKIISAEKRWNKNWNHCRVLTQCQGCGAIQWTDLNSLKNGKSKGCQNCSQPRQVPRWLLKRLRAAKDRCENTNNPEYRNYGERNIQFRFPSVLAAGLYLTSKYGIPDRSMEIDRIDTNRGYEVGNLRFVTRKEQMANRRLTVLSRYEPSYWPYSETTVRKKLAQGESREQIIQDAKDAVSSKRKNWSCIQKRLESMTYEMPEDIIVLPYREGSFTTADMAVV